MCEAFLNDAPDAAMEEHNSSYYANGFEQAQQTK